jgi:phage shock protein A
LISIGKNLNKSQEYDESRVERNSEALEKSLEEFVKAGLGEEQSIQDTEKNRVILQNITTALEKNERQNCSIPLCER